MRYIMNGFVSKETSLQLKGFAILIMLFLHLFMKQDVCLAMKNMILIDNIPLSWWLSRFCAICVPMYMFLSGYGLYVVYVNRPNNMQNGRRVYSLLRNVVLVGILFYPWAIFFPAINWHFDLWGILSTFSGFDPYNCEWWFLCPWIMICFFAKHLFSISDKYGYSKILVLSFCLYFLLRGVVKIYGETLVIMPWRLLYVIMTAIILIFPFFLGAVFARYGIMKKMTFIRGIKLKSIWGLFFLVMIIRIFFIPVGIFDPLIAAFTCCVLCTLPLFNVMKKLGENSTNMWLIHTFYCAYYFHDWFMSLQYPIVMYVALIIISYYSSRLIHNFTLVVKRII